MNDGIACRETQRCPLIIHSLDSYSWLGFRRTNDNRRKMKGETVEGRNCSTVQKGLENRTNLDGLKNWC